MLRRSLSGGHGAMNLRIPMSTVTVLFTVLKWQMRWQNVDDLHWYLLVNRFLRLQMCSYMITTKEILDEQFCELFIVRSVHTMVVLCDTMSKSTMLNCLCCSSTIYSSVFLLYFFSQFFFLLVFDIFAMHITWHALHSHSRAPCTLFAQCTIAIIL